jgi:tetratricopeptide (TPR) repeat protein
VLNLRGLAQMLSGNSQAALALFEQGLALEPRPELRFNHALALLKLSEFAKASAEFEAIHADAQSPYRARAAYHDALALDALGRSREAETWVDRALELEPGNTDALVYAGLLRERRGDLQGAGKAYQQLLQKMPDLPFALLRFGVAAQRAGRTEIARRYFEKVIAASPSGPEAAEARKYVILWGD